MIKTQQIMQEWMDFKEIKAIYVKVTAKFYTQLWKTKSSSSKIRNKMRMPTHHVYSTQYWKSQPEKLGKKNNYKASK